MSAIGKATEEPRLLVCDLEARVANSLPNGIDHSTQLNQIHSSLHDLSHRVAHPTPTQVAAPTPAQPSRPRPLAASALPGLLLRGAPRYPSKGPTQSYPAIVGSTSEFDQAAREVLAAK